MIVNVLMASGTRAANDPGPGILVLGALFLVVGLVLAFNLGGLATSHEQASIRRAQFLRARWPWRSMNLRADEDGMPFPDHLRGLNRPLGGGFAFIGLVVVVGYLYARG